MACRNKFSELSVIIPKTPVSPRPAAQAVADDGNGARRMFIRQYRSPISPLKHPYRPRTIVEPEERAHVIPLEGELGLKAQDIASPDLLAVANLFASMKHALSRMSTAFDILGEQSQRMTTLASDVKHIEEIRKAREALEQQITRQQQEVRLLRQRLEGEIRIALEEKLRSRLKATIQEAIGKQVEERVREELALQLPRKLHDELGPVASGEADCAQSDPGDLSSSPSPQLYSQGCETDQAFEIPTFVIEEVEHSEYSPPSPVAQHLRPLLRPLPTPEQSPAYEIHDQLSMSSRSTSCCSTPVSAYPTVPAPTPITVGAPALLVPMKNGPGLLSPVPPTPSPLAPRDLNSLFVLTSEKIRTLSWNYDSNGFALPSPNTEWPKARTVMKPPPSLWSSPLYIPPPASINFVDFEMQHEYLWTPVLQAESPLLMIPPPLPQPRAGNSVADNLKLLPPLIIH